MSDKQHFIRRANEIAARANARLLDVYPIPNTKADLFVFYVPGEPGRQILVKIADDGCWHYVEGGAKWADMERDFGVEQTEDKR